MKQIEMLEAAGLEDSNHQVEDQSLRVLPNGT